MLDHAKAKEQKTPSGILFWSYGNEKRIPIVLLPGFTGTHKDVSDIANILKEKYWIVIPEFPGWENANHENSSYTIASYADIVWRLIRELFDKKVTLVAHCMGATVALETAYAHKDLVKELILISTPYQEGTVGNIFFRLLTKWSQKVPKNIRPVFFFWRSRAITVPISFFILQTRTIRKKLGIIKKTLSDQPHQNEHVIETNWNSLIEYNYEKLREITIPVHLLHGEKDMLVLPTQAVKLSHIIPHATLELIPRAGHLPPVETPETVARMIEKYID